MASRRQRTLLDSGSRAPAYRLSRLEGGEVTLAELTARGRVLLVFFKVTCPVCQLTVPFLERLHASGNLAIYGISQNDAADTREFNSYFGATYPTLLDSEDDDFPVSNQYGISSVPTMFLVEPDGIDLACDRGLEPQGYGGAGGRRRNDALPPGGQRPGLESRMKFAQLGSRREPR